MNQIFRQRGLFYWNNSHWRPSKLLAYTSQQRKTVGIVIYHLTLVKRNKPILILCSFSRRAMIPCCLLNQKLCFNEVGTRGMELFPTILSG